MSTKNIISGADFFLNDIDEKTFSREELVYKTTEDLLVIMEDHKISKAELARRLGRSKSYVSQILSGSRNMTLNTLSDICFTLGFKPEIKLPVQEEVTSDVINHEKTAPWTNEPVTPSMHEREIVNTNNVIDRTDRNYWFEAA